MNWPPEQTHQRFVFQFRKIPLECLSKPAFIAAVNTTLQQYIEAFQLMYLWFDLKLPFCADGLVLKKPGVKISRNIKYSELFPLFRRFEPDAFTILRLQDAHISDSAKLPSGLRKETVISAARKNVKKALLLAHDFGLDVDECRKEIVLTLYTLWQDVKSDNPRQQFELLQDR